MSIPFSIQDKTLKRVINNSSKNFYISQTFNEYNKLIFDVLVSLILIIITLPFLFLVSILILIESGWPIIYMQKRSSAKNGKIFNCYKFRSMYKKVEPDIYENQRNNEESTLLYSESKNDFSVTPFGKFLRKHSIDELPQLINVLKGEMSIVGPRPLMQSDWEAFSSSNDIYSEVEQRSKIKPGITGLWQVTRKNSSSFSEMVKYNLFYFYNHSILLDIKIILQTIPVVLAGKGI